MNKPIFEKDFDAATMTAIMSFNVPLEKVWEAWTKSELLDKWWGPKPYECKTKEFSFEPGGKWQYSMNGPKGDVHWGLAQYKDIKAGGYFTVYDSFCNEAGEENIDIPGTNWHVAFTEADGITTMVNTTTFSSSESMKQYLEMGAEDGFSASLKQLAALLEK